MRAAVSAFLGRYRGQTRVHTESDLRVFIRWCTDQDLDPLAAARVDIERYVRWLQDVRRYQPSTVSRRLSVVVGFYRVCVIDAILDHSPADYVRRPTVPAESPTLGLGHLQFEALITTARLSTNSNDFALVALLGLLGLRIFEACGASIADLGEEHGHRVLRVRGKGGKVVLVPLPPAVARAIDRAVDDRTSGPILRNTLGARMDRHAATRRLKHLAATAGIRMPRMHPHIICATLRHHHARRWREPARRADRRPSRRSADDHALRPGPQEPRPAPQLHPGRVHGLRDIASAPGLPV
ncbi:tyrosine-type recombinase/integrase [Micromonospora globispora]|uniref:tyrosine-type recombinase/integrase n=1 Tax=Micromonospora globispora TaxID=1450148 RepID=UPI001A9C6ACB|nr:tyrosine-type recombinase/integrase [Micromonospora globispora]